MHVKAALAQLFWMRAIVEALGRSHWVGEAAGEKWDA